MLLITTCPFWDNMQVHSVRVKKPIYSILNMVNSMNKIDDAMSRGANAIQLDVEFEEDCTPRDAHYGVGSSCNCLEADCKRRQEFDRMLDYIRGTTRLDTAKYAHQLCLVVLHLKLEPVALANKYKAGAKIARWLARHLWHGVSVLNTVNVLMSVKTADDINVIRGTNDTINKIMPFMYRRIGYDARDETDTGKMRDMYKQLGMPGHYWLGDGLSTCTMQTTDAIRLQNKLDGRDTDWYGRFAQKVYHWVVDLPMDMKLSLERGVDAIITNRPGRLYGVLKYALNKTHRLATIVDNPWQRFDGWSPLLRKQAYQSVDQLGDDNLTP